MTNPLWPLRRKLHKLMHAHFGFTKEGKTGSYLWLQKVTNKHHVADLNQQELVKAIDAIPKSTVVRNKTWERLENENQRSS